MPETIKTEILIIGSGIAGCSAALTASRFFDQVLLVTKEDSPEASNSYWAQGGIIYKGENDSPQKLIKDTLYAGGNINKQQAIKVLAQDGPQLVKQILIDELGIDFDKNADGMLDLIEEGGHSQKRIIHYKDHTGKEVIQSLLSAITKIPNIRILPNTTIVDLISSTHHSPNPLDVYENTEILGAYALKGDHIIKILSQATVLATGGLGHLYLHSTNPDSATGDGIAMAYRAGARIINMEYTQFHPTTLYHKDSKRFLISESVRGEGAILRNKSLEAFMPKYHPMKDLAPRDVVSRSILAEMTERKESYVYLDLSPIGTPAQIAERFPHIMANCADFQIDISRELVPVVPAYHFSCGGVYTDLNGKTTLKRLFAAGEVACTGLHGANRLASTSLLEGLVYGFRSIKFIKDHWENYKHTKEYTIPDWKFTGHEKRDMALLLQDWSSIKNIMWNYVGPLRSGKRLARAIEDLNHLASSIETFYRDCFPDKSIIELRNGVQTARVIAMSAWKNNRSIGAHYREDFEP